MPSARPPPAQSPVPPAHRHTTSSDSTSTVRVSSPLNPSSSSPSSTPTKNPSQLPPPDPPRVRPRGHSTSTLRDTEPPTLARITSTPTPSTLGQHLDDFAASSFRSRSQSPVKGDGDGTPGRETPPHGAPSTWWGGHELISRPWRDPPKKKKTVPAEQTEGWVHTRERVAQAAASILGTTADVAHEALLLSVELLDFAPIAGLQGAAQTLLNIWDALQMVDMNRLACLRLTERCAEILLSVRQEVKEAGDTVGEELSMPITKLVESFTQVHDFLLKQIHRPFLKRYLKRDEILKQIAGCDKSLSDALGLFSISIQIRILKQVQLAELRRQADTQELISTLMSTRASNPSSIAHAGSLLLEGLPPSSSHPALSASPPPSPSTPMPPPGSPTLHTTPTSQSQILATLRTLHTRQNALDAAHDMVDLRQLMRAALQTSSDAEMLGVLQVGREEMPEAIKTLQRALERVVERESVVVPVQGVGGGGGGGGVVAPVGTSAGNGVVPVDDGKGKGTKRVSVTQVPLEMHAGELVLGDLPEDAPASVPAANLKRSKTIVSIESASSGVSEGWGRTKDTLDREFMESGIDALRRMSKGWETLPSWTITRYEVDREEKIGIGFFSDVYKGTWRSRTVAIKVLAPTTPRKLFVREIEIWRTLRHPNVLELYGASSASGDPPWFFVSAYARHGSLAANDIFILRREIVAPVFPFKIRARGNHEALLSAQMHDVSLLVFLNLRKQFATTEK